MVASQQSLIEKTAQWSEDDALRLLEVGMHDFLQERGLSEVAQLQSDLSAWNLQFTQNDDWPQVLCVSERGGAVQILLHVPESTSWFQGHFVDLPVLPGIVQVHWAAKFVACVFDSLEAGASVTNLKFQNVVLPGNVLQLNLEHVPEKNQVKFSYLGHNKVHSLGALGLLT